MRRLLILAAAAAAAMGAARALSSLSPVQTEEAPAEASGQISWVDPQAGSFGLDTGEEEMEFAAGPGTAISRDGKPIPLEDVQPGDWVVSCTWRMSGEKRVCVRMEIQTPAEEEGLE